jgi:hypothetical protein
VSFSGFTSRGWTGRASRSFNADGKRENRKDKPMQTLETEYTEAEMHAYNEGYEARRQGVDYFDSPHMNPEARDIYLLCAWGAGYLAAEAAETADAPPLKSERLTEMYGDDDNSEQSAEFL